MRWLLQMIAKKGLRTCCCARRSCAWRPLRAPRPTEGSTRTARAGCGLQVGCSRAALRARGREANSRTVVRTLPGGFTRARARAANLPVITQAEATAPCARGCLN